MSYAERIGVEPGKRNGRPLVRGLRISVYDILGWFADGMMPDEILDDFPELEQADIQACLAYAADRERHSMVLRASHRVPSPLDFACGRGMLKIRRRL